LRQKSRKVVAQNGPESKAEFQGSQCVEIPDEHWRGTPKEMHKRADAIMRKFTYAHNPQLGDVHFTNTGRTKTLFDKRTPHEFQSVQALPKIVEQGKVVSTEPDRKGRPTIKAVHKIEYGLKIGDAKYKAEITVRETQTGAKTAHQFYLHRITKNRKTGSLACGSCLAAKAHSPSGR